MTKKHYRLIADALRDAAREMRAEPLTDTQWTLLVGYLSMALHRDNPAFDSVKFRAYAERDRMTFTAV